MSKITEMDLKTIFKVARERYLNLNERQKTIFLLIISFFVFIFGNMFLLSGLKKKATAAKQEVTALRVSNEDMQVQLDVLLTEVQSGLGNPRSAQSQQVQQQREDLDAKLIDYYDDLVPASKMGSVLQQALASEAGLKLVTIRSLRSEEMLSYESPETGERLALYRKGIEMIFEGSYYDSIAYFNKLENLEYKLLWGDLKYVVQSYPNASITVRVFTLSSEEGWIGG